MNTIAVFILIYPLPALEKQLLFCECVEKCVCGCVQPALTSETAKWVIMASSLQYDIFNPIVMWNPPEAVV